LILITSSKIAPCISKQQHSNKEIKYFKKSVFERLQFLAGNGFYFSILKNSQEKFILRIFFPGIDFSEL
jgi:hypothetical protein